MAAFRETKTANMPKFFLSKSNNFKKIKTKDVSITVQIFIKAFDVKDAQLILIIINSTNVRSASQGA